MVIPTQSKAKTGVMVLNSKNFGQRKRIMKRKISSIALIILLAAFLQTPLQAQLQEAGKKDWPGVGVLKGRWQRPDGGYVIEIKNIDQLGKMEVAYFNPRPIHVAKADAARDGSTIKVFIELRDVFYPGSTYHLTYDPKSDQLKGTYFQAALKQTFEVVFDRLK
jgi:hypothetical protein